MKDECGGLVCSVHMNCEDFKDSSEKFVLTSFTQSSDKLCCFKIRERQGIS